MAKPNTLELCRVHLFDDIEKLREAKIADMLIQRIVRLRSAYTFWLEHPYKGDKDIRDHLMHFGVNKSAAYDDIQILKLLLGEMTETSKNFHRFRFNAMIQKAYDMADRKKDARSMVAASNTYAKFNQLDKEDSFKIPWDEIVPQPFEATSDPSVIGIKPVPDIQERIKKMKEKYMSDIEDIAFEEEDFDEEGLYSIPENSV